MGGWLAGLDAFVVGLAYLGALLATRFVARPLLLSILGDAPVVGGWLRGQVDGKLADFERAITPAANASMGTLVSAWDWATVQVRGVLGGLSDFADATYERLYHLATAVVPQALGAGVQWVEGLVEAAKGWALLRIQDAEVALRGEVALVEGEALQAVQQVRGEALRDLQAAERTVLDEIHKAEQTTGQLWQQAEHDASLLVAESESRLVELVRTARADLGAAVGAVEHDLQQLAKAERVALEDSVSVLGGDLQAAEARANQAIAQLDAETQRTIEGILASTPWAALLTGYEASEAIIQADVKTLVASAVPEIRKLLGDADSIRARYAPQVQATLAQIRLR